MPLRDKLQRQQKGSLTTSPPTNQATQQHAAPTTPVSNPSVPHFTFIRTDTTTQEVIRPPVFDGDAPDPDPDPDPNLPAAAAAAAAAATSTLSPVSPPSPSSSCSSPQHRKSRLNPFRRSRAASQSSGVTSPPRARGEGRLSHLLHLDRGGGGVGGGGSRSSSSSSVNIPRDLPQIRTSSRRGDDAQDVEAEWERRATVLVQRNPQFAAACLSPTSAPSGFGMGMDGAASRSRSSSRSRINDPDGDVSDCRGWGGKRVVWLIKVRIGEYSRGDSTT
ncbi:uncharacterized protein BP01DRAFT_360631 [Aspergillus saccharolyticus JOP 1030-1]|uniref:Uncharacterized protein n=1 Tax=Aspergillus saccharolyticus JOP 1030-1 TaxID=1450539 RepID=A0A318Z1Q0_9EURO|nr:hypothetical protein BP01DRAFT_360631 [Aspergillus saccharolyticus JOP 1030-1]PYH41215.1 hypothetical protein BP01DRAFT_360631 [Aspergillus saccharolyticus JOP 1030-1]